MRWECERVNVGSVCKESWVAIGEELVEDRVLKG